MVPVFKYVGERSATKNYCLLSIISVVSNVFGPETLKYWVLGCCPAGPVLLHWEKVPL